MSRFEEQMIPRICNYLKDHPAARNADIIMHMMSYGINKQLPRWMYLIDCAKGNI